MSNEKQPWPIPIYLGSGDEREKNLSNLKRLARKFVETNGRSKDGNISLLIRKISEGKLIVIDPDEYRRPEADSPIAG